MKFLPLREFDEVTSALNFDTPDCHVIGGCDLYTTKAAGSDKKLYREIEKSLESQYESLLRISASVSPPLGSDYLPVNLSRPSPFGSLSQVSSRRTFAYLIATLNASHPDYDFSHILRPADFRKERSLKAVINTIDTTMYSLRPRQGTSFLQVPSQTTYTAATSAPTSSQWGPQIWSVIDKEMSLKDCTVYCWAPAEEPFDEEMGCIWSLNYFFFNKDRKRVAYIYVRGVPVMTQSPSQPSGMPKRSASAYDSGANKRARFWLGDRADNLANDPEADLEEGDVAMWSNDEDFSAEDVDVLFEGDDFCDDYEDEADDESDDMHYKAPRGVSEDIAASMDIDN